MNKKKWCVIQGVARESFQAVGFDGDHLTDEQLLRVKTEMKERYMKKFLDDLKEIAEEMQLPRLPEGASGVDGVDWP